MNISESDLQSLLSRSSCKIAGERRVETPKPSKYRNQRVVIDGMTFDSKGEAQRFQELRMLEKAGKITELKRQVPFQIIPPLNINGRKVQATVYRADFVYQENGERVVEDFKGALTDTYLLKRKLMWHVHGIAIRETGK